MALSMPDAVSTVRGGALPWRGACVTVLGMMPPSFREIDDAGHFPGVAERTGRDQDWVLQMESAESDGKVGHDNLLRKNPDIASGNHLPLHLSNDRDWHKHCTILQDADAMARKPL